MKVVTVRDFRDHASEMFRSDDVILVTREGSPAGFFLPWDTPDVPVEVQESTLPILVEESALDVDSAGAGQYRGGLGYRRTFRMLSETATLQLNIDRHTCLPWGLHGGQAARPNRAYIQASPDSDWELVLKRDGIRLEPGARVQLIGGGGGGWGDPAKRDPAEIRRDVILGYVSAQAAADAYGAAADPSAGPANPSELAQ